MKKYFLYCITLLLICCCINDSIMGQNVAINNDGSAPNANAILDVKSTNKGILIPRLDYNNRPSVSVPAGMLIFVTTNGPLGNNAYYFYDGTKWVREKTSADVDSLSLSQDTLSINPGNYVVVGNILNLIGYYKCNTAYTQLSTDNNNCGSCGNVCNFSNASSSCISGICSLNCNAGFANCDNIKTNGCEVNITNNVFNCGGCGVACATFPNSTGPSCVGSACGIGGCNTGFANCDNITSNGCEVNLTNNVNNCGSCGNICSFANASANCISSTCGIGSCNAGFANCDGLSSNGCEINTTNNVNNCGSCGIACPTGPNVAFVSCNASTCGITCNAGYANCDGLNSNGCEINLTNNVNNCGSCGLVCFTGPNVSAVSCNASTCGIAACNAGFANCDGNLANGCEINTNTNHNNCGSCGHVCSGVQTCTGGVCM